jgi:hypothetical protein
MLWRLFTPLQIQSNFKSLICVKINITGGEDYCALKRINCSCRACQPALWQRPVSHATSGMIHAQPQATRLFHSAHCICCSQHKLVTWMLVFLLRLWCNTANTCLMTYPLWIPILVLPKCSFSISIIQPMYKMHISILHISISCHLVSMQLLLCSQK